MAKYCPDCHVEIPSPKLHCKECLVRRMVENMIAGQGEYVRFVLAGQLNLRLRRTRQTAEAGHISLFGLPRFAYCGRPLSRGYPVREEYPYVEKLRPAICKQCLAVFDRNAKEAHADA